jgi:formylglycine-generating enzyme required for sulfatase activity
MALVPVPGPTGLRFVLLDVLPVTWDAWMAHAEATLPDDADPFCPFLGATADSAATFARSRGARLPTLAELEAAWGSGAYPWGPHPDLRKGQEGRPRFDVCPVVGQYPPAAFGHFDLGAWLWHLTAEGLLFGGAPGDMGPPAGRPYDATSWPVGFRCAVDVG